MMKSQLRPRRSHDDARRLRAPVAVNKDRNGWASRGCRGMAGALSRIERWRRACGRQAELDPLAVAAYRKGHDRPADGGCCRRAIAHVDLAAVQRALDHE